MQGHVRAIAYIFSRVLRDSMNRYVGRSVGRSVCLLVGRSPLAFFGVFGRFWAFFALLLLLLVVLSFGVWSLGLLVL